MNAPKFKRIMIPRQPVTPPRVPARRAQYDPDCAQRAYEHGKAKYGSTFLTSGMYVSPDPWHPTEGERRYPVLSAPCTVELTPWPAQLQRDCAIVLEARQRLAMKYIRRGRPSPICAPYDRVRAGRARRVYLWGSDHPTDAGMGEPYRGQ